MEEREFVVTGIYPSKIEKIVDKILKQTDKKIIRIRSWCKGCGLCVEICPRQAVTINKSGKVELTDPDKCTSCGLCELVCPDFAIIVSKIKRKQTDAKNNC